MSCQHSFLRRMAAGVLCALALSAPALAAEVESGEVYCFAGSDFSRTGEALAGICVTGLPDGDAGCVKLGSRVIRPGDILTADQLAQMTFCPIRSEEDAQATVEYLPIYSDRVAPESTMVISIRGKEDKAPVAEDSQLETYKNLPNEGQLRASDPEQEQLTFTLTRGPRRGEVILRPDGSFLYTPKNNKVGTDSFTYTAADPAGNVSREATVTVQILKPADARQYADTSGNDCRFAAEWMRNTGIFAGETVSGQLCFSAEAEVTRGEFLAMLMQTLELPVDRTAAYTGFADEAEDWLKPYLAAALRSGIIQGYPSQEGAVFCPEQVITGDEAAMMICSALDLAAPTGVQPAQGQTAWAAQAQAAAAAAGLQLEDGPLDRGNAAQALYLVSKLAADRELTF